MGREFGLAAVLTPVSAQAADGQGASGILRASTLRSSVGRRERRGGTQNG